MRASAEIHCPKGHAAAKSIGGVPAAELVAGSGQPLAEAKWAQQAVFTQIEQYVLALLKLLLGQSRIEIDLRILHLVEQGGAEGRRRRCRGLWQRRMRRVQIAAVAVAPQRRTSRRE